MTFKSLIYGKLVKSTVSNFVSSKDAEEERVMHSKSNNEECMHNDITDIANNGNDFFEKLIKPPLSIFHSV